mmetsp:Transcript_12333/g.33303  ORF Transcript_12333/g.33303 Transcript_12333/m.33303 type:complete len:200 (+) Transcript_12333:1138-1737(+)
MTKLVHGIQSHHYDRKALSVQRSSLIPSGVCCDRSCLASGHDSSETTVPGAPRRPVRPAACRYSSRLGAPLSKNTYSRPSRCKPRVAPKLVTNTLTSAMLFTLLSVDPRSDCEPLAESPASSIALATFGQPCAPISYSSLRFAAERHPNILSTEIAAGTDWSVPTITSALRGRSLSITACSAPLRCSNSGDSSSTGNKM